MIIGAMYLYYAVEYQVVKFIAIILATILLTIAGNLDNSLQDIEADKLNNKLNPLLLSYHIRRICRGLIISSLIIGLILSVFISIDFAIFYLINASLLWAYNRWLKGIIILGNVVVSYLTASVLLSFAIVGFDYNNHALPNYLLLAFNINLCREFIKCCEDKLGDSAVGIKTIAHILSTKKIYLICLVSILLNIVFIALNIWSISTNYWILCIPLLIALPFNLKDSYLANYSNQLKLSMVLGILSIILCIPH